MKSILRVMAVVVSVIGLWAFSMLGAAFFALSAKPGLFAAWLVSGAFAALCVRCGLWLWSERPFWRDRARCADVITTVAAFLAIFFLAYIEQATEGTTQAVIKIGAVGLVVGVYLVSRRFAPFNRSADAQIK